MMAARNVDALRVPPSAVDAEQAVLGGLMLRPAALAQIDWLMEEDFYRHDHQLLFRALANLIGEGKPCDAITVGEYIESNGLADKFGDAAYVIDLASSTPSAANVPAYAEIVREKAVMRQIIDLTTRAGNAAFGATGASSRDIASALASKMLEVSGRTAPRTAFHIGELARGWYAEMLRRHENDIRMLGHTTGLHMVDEITLGLCGGDLIYLGARPSMGKTALSLMILMHIAGVLGQRSMMFSLEMTASRLFSRMVAAIADVPLRWVQTPDSDPGYWSATGGAVTRIQNMPLVIDDASGLTAAQIVARAKREHLRAPITGMVVIDHMNIVARPGKNEASEISQDSAMFKGLAKFLGVPVMVLAQLGREVEKRQNKRPTMADLRSSGAMEQDADVVCLLYRDDYYAKQENRDSEHPGMVEAIFGKVREGESGRTAWLVDALARGALRDFDGEAPQRHRPSRPESTSGWKTRRRSGADAAAGEEAA